MIDTVTEVCNAALGEIGAKLIPSYELGTSLEARTCQRSYDLTLHSLLRRHQWAFATVREKLLLDPIQPDSEWAARYLLPTGMVRLIKIVSGQFTALTDFSIEGNYILTQTAFPELPIVYVSSAVPVSLWDPLFLTAVKYQLAANLAPTLAKSQTLAQSCTAKLEQLALPAAQTADARESLSGENFGPMHMLANSVLVNSRFAAGGGVSYRPDPFP